MKITYHKTILAALSLAALVASCKKDNDDNNQNTPDTDVSSAADYTVADAAFTDVANIADEAATGSLTSYRNGTAERILTTCAQVTVDTVVHRITIDFGTTDCLCKDGNYRRGIIYVDYTGQYADSGSSHTISFNNYYVNFNKIDGSKTVVNTGRNASGNLTFSITVNGSVTWDAQYGGGTSTYISSRTREWVAGESTMVWNDDVYMISGTASGTTRNGVSWTLATQTPLRKRIGFRHFTQGIVDFTPANKPTRTIDYGYLNGAEDNLAQVTINGYTFTITLR
jgi:hypothetical protein